ncbi:MAG: transposon-transfer assisting family protein [Lachnospiraceae bacterium]|nr:transposon-transfer assisting family protein [Lachnospiraceae bacterium]
MREVMTFSIEESNIAAIYRGKNRGITIQSIASVLNNIDDRNMREVMLSTIEKLANITDEEFENTKFVFTD